METEPINFIVPCSIVVLVNKESVNKLSAQIIGPTNLTT